jgi:hypothetical protein
MFPHFEHLSRLTLAVAVLYVWLVSIRTRTVRDGIKDLVDRTDRRDLSIFQIRLIHRKVGDQCPYLPNSALFLLYSGRTPCLKISWN